MARRRTFSVTSTDAIPEAYQATPIGDLLRFHDLGEELLPYERAAILIGMCMDHRKSLRIPDNFAYVLRTGGADLRQSEFKVSYAIAVGGVRAIALLAHDGCGMVNLASRRDSFVAGLVDAGWARSAAEDHFRHFAPLFEIGNEIDFVVAEAERLRRRYPRVVVAPLFYDLGDGKLHGIEE